MKTIIFSLLFVSINAFALTAVEVRECAKGSEFASKLIDNESVYRTAGPDIYKIKPTSKWSALPQSIFISKKDRGSCFIRRTKKNPLEGDVEIKKKTELSADEVGSCEATQMSASKLTTGEVDTLLTDALEGYALDIAEINFLVKSHVPVKPGETKDTKDKTIDLLKAFEKCERLKPASNNKRFDKTFESVQDKLTQLAQSFNINRKIKSSKGAEQKAEPIR